MDDHAGPILWYANTAFAALDVEMTAHSDPVWPGERLTYALTASNAGALVLTGVVLDAQVPDYTQAYNDETNGGGDCVGVSALWYAGDVMRWQLGDLAPDDDDNCPLKNNNRRGGHGDRRLSRRWGSVGVGRR